MASIVDELPYFQNLSNILIAKFLVALIILLLGFIIAKVLGKLFQRVLHGIELNKLVKKVTKLKINLEQILGLFFTYSIYFASIIMALNQLGLTTTILNMLSAAILIIIIISIFLSIRDSIPNAMAGFSLIRQGNIKENDYIKTKDIEGKVEKITLTEIQLMTRKGDVIHIPNSVLTTREYTIRRPKSK